MTHLHNVNGTITQLKRGGKKRILNELSVVIRLAPGNSSQENRTSENNDDYRPIVKNCQR